MKIQTWSTKLSIVTVLASMLSTTPVKAGIPTVDAANLTHNIRTSIESVAQTLKQIQQYDTQLQQYQNQIQNTIAPSAYIWDQAQGTINHLMRLTDTLSYYRNQAGSIDAYLDRFQDVNYYRGSACFTSEGCSTGVLAAMEQNRNLAAESQKRANDAMFRGLDQQQTNLRNDAARLRSLQLAAQGATGQMQAIGYANQLASQQANQLLQIRSLLIAQQNAVATKMQTDADLEARQRAAHITSTETRIERTARPQNWLELIH